ncbi:MAG TPA: alpha/beta fold hydrolase [Steroidobacteraceae bacterium]|nr:alpha/beta fold hydrolase [Steroidobacteraceae bacterium]
MPSGSGASPASPAYPGSPASANPSASPAAGATSATPAGGAPLNLAACRIEDPARTRLVLARCGYLDVPENPANPRGRHIGLYVARVAAINRRKQSDPVFILAGGPGMAATSFYASVAFAFERIHRDRDIVLVDQRGTGRSNPLNCVLDDNDLLRSAESEIVARAQRCLSSLAAKSDVRFYTTSIAVRDLEQVRQALGYDQINLYGVSYGTRVAQHYLRRFPAHARTAILDGVVPPQLTLGPAIAINAEQALDRILARCVREPECHAQFGDPQTAYRTLRDSLGKRPAAVTLADPTSGQITKLEFTPFHLGTVLRLASYTPEQAALLPLALHSAAESGDFTSLASQFLLVMRSYGEVVAYGMHNSVVCSEDAPFYDPAHIDRTEIAQTYLGTSQLDGLSHICGVWPRGAIDPDFHAPLHADVPVLLLSGSDDPVTPPPDAELARKGLSHSQHIVLQGFGHGQLTAPCMDRVMADFVEHAQADVDASCAHSDQPLPFFTSVGGPPP